MKNNVLGNHIILEIKTENVELLKDVEFIEKALKEAAIKARATILNSFFHKFGGAGGVTGVLALAESHLSIHTWPEYSSAAIDIFMCNNNPYMACDFLIEKFKATNSTKISLVRTSLE